MSGFNWDLVIHCNFVRSLVRSFVHSLASVFNYFFAAAQPIFMQTDHSMTTQTNLLFYSFTRSLGPSLGHLSPCKSPRLQAVIRQAFQLALNQTTIAVYLLFVCSKEVCLKASSCQVQLQSPLQVSPQRVNYKWTCLLID